MEGGGRLRLIRQQASTGRLELPAGEESASSSQKTTTTKSHTTHLVETMTDRARCLVLPAASGRTVGALPRGTGLAKVRRGGVIGHELAGFARARARARSRREGKQRLRRGGLTTRIRLVNGTSTAAARATWSRATGLVGGGGDDGRVGARG